MVAREGQTTYNGVFDTASKIWKEEGGRALWKGAPGELAKNDRVTSSYYVEVRPLYHLYYYRRRVCVCVCLQNWTNFCPYALISTPNVP